ncbi:uncharacterized protein J3D65DRAFT_307426 [Phyllosticta citribraziliensis]|uniref:Transmembrane protein n=1 Tax=Phyllosticta citribraziliensis TaxID=989973 RepID=A0ABR1LZL5_9PEZI
MMARRLYTKTITHSSSKGNAMLNCAKKAFSSVAGDRPMATQVVEPLPCCSRRAPGIDVLSQVSRVLERRHPGVLVLRLPYLVGWWDHALLSASRARLFARVFRLPVLAPSLVSFGFPCSPLRSCLSASRARLFARVFPLPVLASSLVSFRFPCSPLRSCLSASRARLFARVFPLPVLASSLVSFSFPCSPPPVVSLASSQSFSRLPGLASSQSCLSASRARVFRLPVLASSQSCLSASRAHLFAQLPMLVSLGFPPVLTSTS